MITEETFTGFNQLLHVLEWSSADALNVLISNCLRQVAKYLYLSFIIFYAQTVFIVHKMIKIECFHINR